MQSRQIKIINQAGTVYASYVYDAWGNVKSVSGDTALRELNPFRYRGYVYDSESVLYYLQSRYYDPFTGRFINADVYCDTQSGSPLSTNMFAYCENNSITFFDKTGYWSAKIHESMCKYAGFKSAYYSLVLTWAKKADEYPCASTSFYSAPFHSRDNGLELAKKFFNKAIDIKISRKKFNFTASFFGYTAKNGNYNKTNDAVKKLINTLNSCGSANQSKMLLGLAIHTVQDYFAHCIKISLCVRSSKYYNSKINRTTYTNIILTKLNNALKSKYDVPLSAFEDNVDFISWRASLAQRITAIFYSRWVINKKINTLKPIVMENKPVTYYKMYKSYYYSFKTYEYDYLLI